MIARCSNWLQVWFVALVLGVASGFGLICVGALARLAWRLARVGWEAVKIMGA